MSVSESTNCFMKSGTGNFTIFVNNKSHSVGPDHLNYRAIVERLKQSEIDWENFESLLDVPKAIEKNCKDGGLAGVEVRDGQVWFNGQVSHNVVADKILEFMREGFDFTALKNFLENLMKNPSKKSVDRLYAFLEKHNHPITLEGEFLAFKRVRDDYRDFYSGKYDNSPGQTFSMPRNEVEDDPMVSCAAGGHVASLQYARDCYHSGQGRLIVVKVNPADVSSVPYDYNEGKMRVCKYVSLADYDGGTLNQADYVPTSVCAASSCCDNSYDCEQCEDGRYECDCDDDEFTDSELEEMEQEDDDEIY